MSCPKLDFINLADPEALAPEDLAELNHHIDDCPQCQQQRGRYEHLQRDLKAPVVAPAIDRHRLFQAILNEAQTSHKGENMSHDWLKIDDSPKLATITPPRRRSKPSRRFILGLATTVGSALVFVLLLNAYLHLRELKTLTDRFHSAIARNDLEAAKALQQRIAVLDTQRAVDLEASLQTLEQQALKERSLARLEGAERSYQDALAKQRRGLLKERREKLSEASKALQAVIKERGPERRSLFLQARLERALHLKPKLRKETCQALVTLSSDSYEGLIARAWLAEIDGLLDQAIKCYDLAIQIAPKETLPRVARADLYRRKGEYSKALTEIDQIVLLDLKESNHRFVLAHLLIDQERYNDARKKLNIARRYDKGHPRGPALQAMIELYGEKNTQGAAQLAQEALQRNPADGLGHFLKGRIAHIREDHEAALASYQVAAKLSPGNPVPLYWQGRAYEALGQYTKALDHFQAVLAIDALFWRGYDALGRLYHRLKQYDRALSCFSKAIELNPREAVVFYHRARTYDELGRTQQALADLDRTLALNPMFLKAFRARAALFLKMGQEQRALADLNQALRLNPKGSEVRYLRAQVLLRLHRSKEALSELSQLRAVSPKRHELSCLIGIAQLELHRYDEAERELEHFLANARPGDPWIKTAKSALQRLNQRRKKSR